MQCSGAKSPTDDLVLSHGVVLRGAAASLRSFETKPSDWQICPHRTDTSVYPLSSEVSVSVSPSPPSPLNGERERGETEGVHLPPHQPFVFLTREQVTFFSSKLNLHFCSGYFLKSDILFWLLPEK